jgi:hypothetical protein
MSVVRVIYKPDNSVAIFVPAWEAKRKLETPMEYLERSFAKALSGVDRNGLPNPLKGLPYEDIDRKDMPKTDRDKWRRKAGGGVEIDLSVMTQQEKKQSLFDQIDLELEKETPDPIKILKLRTKIQKKQF